MKTMEQKDYKATIAVNGTAADAFNKIGHVREWWTKDIEGRTEKAGDLFTVSFGETYVDFEILEVIPNQKIVWLVTDCNLYWLEDKKEWKNTKIVFDIITKNGKTELQMTHIGLVPEVECYDNCKNGWDFYVGKSLLSLINENKGLANVKPSDH